MSKNAIKTGAYSRDTLLPWESAEDYEKLRDDTFPDLQPQGNLEIEIASNIVENRWLRRRLQRMTAISTYRHAFGQTLVETGVGSWSDALKAVRKLHADHHRTLERIATSTQKVAQHAANWTTSELEELAEKVVAQCQATIDELTRIESALDEEASFFREYSPKQLEKRVKLENALDTQFDKLMARLTILREARILRDKLRGSQDAAGDSAVKGSHDDVDAASKSPRGEFDLAELDREDVSEFGGRTSACGRPLDSGTAHRNHHAVDPLLEFIGETPSRDDGEASDSAEADPDDDDTDEWGEPKTRNG